MAIQKSCNSQKFSLGDLGPELRPPGLAGGWYEPWAQLKVEVPQRKNKFTIARFEGKLWAHIQQV